MSMQSHVDPCTFIVYMHIAGDQIDETLAATLASFEPTQGGSPRALFDEMPFRSRQIQFHEAYHFWQGLRLPFLYRYAFIAYRQSIDAFAQAAAHDPDPRRWDIVLPEFARLSLDNRIAASGPGELYWGASPSATFPVPTGDEIRVAPLDLLECAASLAEFQVTADGDKASPTVLARWAKRNPAALAILDFAVRFLGDARLAQRALLPLVNASFHTSEPVRAFASLLQRLWAFARDDDTGRRFLAEPEPCRWGELCELWLDDLRYDAPADSDGGILGSAFQRLTLRQWVGGHHGNAKTGTMIHPFLGPLARRWLALEASGPDPRMLLDQPGWVRHEAFYDWLDAFTPPLSIYRFHLGDGRDRAMFVGRADAMQFTAPPMRSAAQWRGFVADTLTMYGAIRRASGAHFDAEQRTCHHRACPHYAANLCNTYPIIPQRFEDCGFPVRLQGLIERFKTRSHRGKH